MSEKHFESNLKDVKGILMHYSNFQLNICIKHAIFNTIHVECIPKENISMKKCYEISPLDEKKNETNT